MYKMYTKLLLLVALFVVLTPGVLLSLPHGRSTLTVAITHAVVFVILYKFVLKRFLE